MVLTEDMGIDRQDGAGIVAKVFRDFVNWCAQAEPRRRGKVAQVVALESERKFSYDSDGELRTLLISEEVVIGVFAARILPKDVQGSG